MEVLCTGSTTLPRSPHWAANFSTPFPGWEESKGHFLPREKALAKPVNDVYDQSFSQQYRLGRDRAGYIRMPGNGFEAFYASARETSSSSRGRKLFFVPLPPAVSLRKVQFYDPIDTGTVVGKVYCFTEPWTGWTGPGFAVLFWGAVAERAADFLLHCALPAVLFCFELRTLTRTAAAAHGGGEGSKFSDPVAPPDASVKKREMENVNSLLAAAVKR